MRRAILAALGALSLAACQPTQVAQPAPMPLPPLQQPFPPGAAPADEGMAPGAPDPTDPFVPVVEENRTGFGAIFRGPDTGPSPAAIAALPQGIGPEFLAKDANGCYVIALEAGATEGVPLRDAAGQQVCDA